ncbi:Bifunctional adenosylcobalamin biosynthesis protein CobP [subsurface metagenome]
MACLTFILGGARSGKSCFAQGLARKIEEERGGQVVYLATGSAGDEEMRERIAKHRKSRPGNWKTVEAECEVSTAIAKECKESAVIIIDCITLLITNILLAKGEDAEELILAEVEHIIMKARKTGADIIIVSNEVGTGIVPEYKLGRIFRDISGRIHQLLSAEADEVYFMTAGLAQRLK